MPTRQQKQSPNLLSNWNTATQYRICRDVKQKLDESTATMFDLPTHVAGKAVQTAMAPLYDSYEVMESEKSDKPLRKCLC